MEHLRSPKTVLVVEDEILVRMLAIDVLSEAGFDVFEAEGAVAALDLLQREGRIDLLFTDVRMPGDMDGIDLAELAQMQCPGLPVIITSAHCRLIPPAANVLFLPKPYQTRQLVALVRSKLGGPAGVG